MKKSEGGKVFSTNLHIFKMTSQLISQFMSDML